MTTYAPAKISARKSRTPDGFLVLHDVRLSRVGEMLYGPGQTPIPVGPDGVARITRDEAVVFDPDTISSFIGKPVTIGHPPEAVTPENWAQLAGGHILSARRGAPPEQDFMVGDVMVTRPDVMKMADEGCEISCGYDAAYEQTAPGRGRQTRIVGNHLAFLPDGKRGRCGPMCYVGDQSMEVEEPTMTTKTTLFGGAALLKKVFGAKDDAELSRVLDEAVAEEARAADRQRIADLEAQVAALTRDEGDKDDKKKDDDEDDDDEDDKKSKTDDAAYVAANLPRVKAAAEILAPGIVFPTHDAADLVATRDAMCACQRAALKKATERPEGKVAVEKLFGDGANFDTLDALTLDSGFHAVAALIGAFNNHTLSAMAMARNEGGELATAQQRAIDADKRSLERWGKTA